MREELAYSILNPAGSKPPLFWVTPDAVQFPLFRMLGRDQPIVCLRGPTFGPDDPPYSMDRLVEHYIRAIERVQPDGPYALGGFCVAATLAREVAVKLVARGRLARLVVMIDPPDPAESRRAFASDPLAYRIRFALHRWGFHLQRMRRIGLRGSLQYLGGVVQGIHKRLTYHRSQKAHERACRSGTAMPERFNDNYHASIAAFWNSMPEIYRGRTLIVRPAEAPVAAFERANSRWASLIGGEIETVETSGDGESMWSAPHVAVLAHAIAARLG